MKKMSVLLSLLICLVLVAPVSAQSKSWPTAAGTSGVQAVNMDPASSAEIMPTYVAEDGTQYVLPSQTLGVGGSYTWYAEPSTQATFRGAVMLSSDAPVAAIAKTEWGSGGASGAAAYSGKSAGALEISLPLLVVEHYGTSSAVTVQNTDMNSAITVDVVFTSGAGSFTKPLPINAGSSSTLDLAFDSDFVDPNTGSSAGWVGSAVVRSASVPVVAAAHTTSQSGGFVYAYDGFTAFDQTVAFAPLVRRGFYGFTTGIQVADVSGNGGTVTVEYSGQIWNSDGTKTPYTYTDDEVVAPNGSVTFYQGWPYFNDDTKSMPSRFLGSAKISISSGGAIAVVVNDQSSKTASAYSGFFASEGSASVISPLARNSFAGFTTGIQVQNVGADSVDVSVAYTTSPLSSNTSTPPASAARTLAAGGSTTFYLPSDWGTSSSETNWLGSAEFTATGTGEVKVVAITNDQSVAGTGDTAIFNCPAK